MPKLLWLLHHQNASPGSINSWRISVLCRSSRQYLALAAGHAVLDVPSRPRRTAPHEVPPAVSPPVLGSGGSVNPDSLVSGLSSGSAVVAALAPPFSGGVSPSGVSRPGLLVRCLGRRLGGTLGPSHRFRPLEPRRGSAVQRQGTSGRTPWSPPLPVISSGEDSLSFLRQQHGSGLPSQGGGHKVSLPEHSSAGILRWSESLAIRLAPQFIPGFLRVLADTLSRPHQLPHTEWSLNQDVLRSLSRRWPVQIDLQSSSDYPAIMGLCCFRIIKYAG